jgi:thiamine biosynthesis lipoprotein
MNSHPLDDSERIARKLSELEQMGFERVHQPLIQTESERAGRRVWKVTGVTPAMSTLVRVTVVDRSESRAQEAIGRAFEEMERLIAILTRFDDSSPVSLLNLEERITDPPPELAQVVARGLSYHAVSRGIFDITVRPLVDLFQNTLGGAMPREPAETEIREALQRVDAGKVEQTKSAIAFRGEGMSVTLDGIAKGYIVDAIAGELRRHRVRNFLIDAGGDIRTSGRRENREPWRIAVQDPEKEDAYPDILTMTNGAVATSGSYEVFYDQERMYHHIVDTTSGRSPNLHASVSVKAPTTMAADALATTLFLMEPAEGIGLVESLRGCECLLVDTVGDQLKSRGWNR